MRKTARRKRHGSASPGAGDAGAVMNVTRKAALHAHPVWAAKWWQQTVGLMFRKPRDECLVFPFKPARQDVIQMWFVFAPIDVLALDAAGTVVALKEGLRPWRSWPLGVHAATVIELPHNTIAATRTRIGDTIALPRPSPAEGFWRWHHYALLVALNAALAALLLFAAMALVALLQGVL